ncbi:hypothetical protein C2I33_11100 [Ralstonia solanacearum]|uniref:hypothetical protein n=1 Tax=Ralstonia solanacearum TaxID=305 RepID=UPI0005ABD110|nr:hypothetical protein [Ralstonia solanacearum]TYZ54863.1 hypothetical protein C2I33_11100 [Ralstonia solanacearum]
MGSHSPVPAHHLYVRSAHVVVGRRPVNRMRAGLDIDSRTVEIEAGYRSGTDMLFPMRAAVSERAAPGRVPTTRPRPPGAPTRARNVCAPVRHAPRLWLHLRDARAALTRGRKIEQAK